MRTDRYKTLSNIEDEPVNVEDIYMSDESDSEPAAEINAEAEDAKYVPTHAAEASDSPADDQTVGTVTSDEAAPEAQKLSTKEEPVKKAPDLSAKEETANKSKSDKKRGRKQDDPAAQLLKLSKKELLEIMLRQGEEIDALRAKVAELEDKLDDKEFTLSRVGSIAEASLAVTDIFKEAEKAAKIYLSNIRRMVDEKASGK